MKEFVLYLDIEHPIALLDRRQRAKHLRGIHRKSQLLRDLSGCGCISQSFIWLDGSHLDDLPLLAMVISGNTTDWSRYTASQLRQPFQAIRASSIPILGICGGHQLVCKALGGTVAPMRRLGKGEHDPHPGYRPGYFKERGYTMVDVDVDHGLFRGMAPRIEVHESHYCEVKRVPRILEVIGSSPDCRVQAIAHRRRSVYGVQFHPETFDDLHMDGKTVLENFFAIARSAP